MMRSLFSAVSGLKNHQTRMDVIGSNLANVNTVGFKASRVTFKEGFAQMFRSASRPGLERGGTNPAQVGLGMQVGSIDTLFTQGNFESTGIATDLAVQGSSFFVVARGNQNMYTRAGNFTLDAEGYLVMPSTGYRVQGRTATGGVMSNAVGGVRLPFGAQAPAQATTTASLAGNLNATAAIGDTAETSIEVFDSTGVKHAVRVIMTKVAPTAPAAAAWDWAVDPASLAATGCANIAGAGTFEFDASGNLIPGAAPVITFDPPGAASSAITLTVDSGAAGLTQYGAPSNAILRDQNGYTSGQLENFSIDQSGTVYGVFTNGVTQPLAQLVLADFNNPSGLLKQGDSVWSDSNNSGAPMLGYAGEGSRSTIMSGALETSNVDLAGEFTSMIGAQRGFQANGRVISAADEMLQEVVNLIR